MDQDINDLLYDTDDLKKEKVNGGFFDFIKAWFYNDVERHMFFEDEIIVAQKLKTMDVMANTYALERKKYFEKFLKDSHKQKGFFTRIKDRDFAFYKDPTRVKLWSSITDTDVYSFFIKSSVNQMLGGGNIAQLTSLPKFKFNAIASVNSENISAAASLAATGEKSFLGSSCINVWSNLPVFDSERGDVKSFIPLYLRMSGKASSALFNYNIDIGARILKQENSTNTNKAVFNIGLTYHPITNNAFVEFNKDQQSLLYSYNNLSKDAYVTKIKSIVDAKVALNLSFEHEEIRSSQGFSVLATVPARGYSIDDLNRKYRPMIWV
uniref:Pathogenicity determinant protein D n=1 Tax=Francisella novicida TaxID=264 RepID=B3TNP3_FRANO|nr:pathogenicity determinant protein D [Francisella tularensis subsp. novicida]